MCWFDRFLTVLGLALAGRDIIAVLDTQAAFDSPGSSGFRIQDSPLGLG